MIAGYILTKADEEFCCEDECCETYIKKGKYYIIFIELLNDNGAKEINVKKKCIECAVEDIKDDIEERTFLLHRVENL